MNLIFFLVLFMIASCGKPSKLYFDAPPEKVGFAELQTGIITDKCVSCHKGFVNEARLLRFIKPGDPENSTLFEVVKDGSMPPKGPPLTSRELEMLRVYILNLRPVE